MRPPWKVRPTFPLRPLWKIRPDRDVVCQAVGIYSFLAWRRLWHRPSTGDTIYDLRFTVGSWASARPREHTYRQQTGGIDTPAENDYTPTFRVQPPTPANYGVLVGRETIVFTPIEKYAATSPHIDTPKKYKKPKTESDTKQKNTRSKSHRLP